MEAVNFNPVHLKHWGKTRRRIPLYYEAYNHKLIICGNYRSVCGGCDGIGSARKVFQLYEILKAWYPEAVIISEGLLLSEDVKWTKEAYRRSWEPRVYFLRTTADKCINNINFRRKEAGKEPLENELNTRARVEVIERARLKLREQGLWTRAYSSTQTLDDMIRRLA